MHSVNKNKAFTFFFKIRYIIQSVLTIKCQNVKVLKFIETFLQKFGVLSTRIMSHLFFCSTRTNTCCLIWNNIHVSDFLFQILENTSARFYIWVCFFTSRALSVCKTLVQIKGKSLQWKRAVCSPQVLGGLPQMLAASRLLPKLQVEEGVCQETHGQRVGWKIFFSQVLMLHKCNKMLAGKSISRCIFFFRDRHSSAKPS